MQRRESPDFRSPEVGISGEGVDLTIGCMVPCTLYRHELRKDRKPILPQNVGSVREPDQPNYTRKTY